ncbi:MAG: hypothetical protein MI748_11645 [Opitutales bacterium]|nr:hypothetical protein [Opitutales bacterium]
MEKRWKKLQETRDDYLVGYLPSSIHNHWAVLTITYINDVNDFDKVEQDLLKEIKSWIERYPIPLMGVARQPDREIIPFRKSSHEEFLYAYPSAENLMIIYDSKDDLDNKIDRKYKSTEHRCEVYRELDYVSDEEIEETLKERVKMVRMAKAIVIIWGVVIPIAIAILGYFNLFLVGFIATVYSIWKAIDKYLQLKGIKKESDSEKAKKEDERLRDHHHYHCKLNPAGFHRLRNENFNKMNRDSTLKDFNNIKENQT